MDRGLQWLRSCQRKGGDKKTRCQHCALLWLQSRLGVIPCDQMIGFMQPPATSHQRLDWSGVTLALLQTVTEADPHPGPDPDLPLASQLSRHFPFSYVNYWSEVLVSKQLSTINIYIKLYFIAISISIFLNI